MRRKKLLVLTAVSAALLAASLPAQPVWQWCQRTFSRGFAKNPAPRSNLGLAYDAGRGRILLFGGNAGGVMNDTWEWAYPRWKQLTPKTAPSAREAMMAYDVARQQVVLFGGYRGNWIPAGDTWVWNGSDWSQASPASSPSPRWGHAMAYDAARGVLVLFGGRNATTFYRDTWEWNGSTWKQVKTALSPPALEATGMCYHAARRRIVLFGGIDANNVKYGALWEYDGTNWQLRILPSPPSPRYGAPLVYDPTRQVAVLFGGNDGSKELADTWEYSGAAWRRVPAAPLPSTTPPGRRLHRMVFDAAIGQVVMFGGYGRPDTTWVYTQYTAPDYAFAGPGHPGGGLELVIQGAPTIGSPVYASFRNPYWAIPGGFNVVLLGLYLNPAAIIDPPGVVDRTLVHLTPFAASNVSGDPVNFRIDIPNSPLLKGLPVVVEAGSLEATYVFRATDAVRVTIR